MNQYLIKNKDKPCYALSTGLLVLVGLFSSVAVAKGVIEFDITKTKKTTNTPRLGINLGEWVSWGASQYEVNVLKNPGFEGIIDRTIVIVKTADKRSFSDDVTWTKRPDGFWAGAQFDIRSGQQIGSKGVLVDSLAVGSQGLPQFVVNGDAPPLLPGDVISLTRVDDTGLPKQWWFSKVLSAGQLSVDNQDKRPESPGLRSLAIKPQAEKPVEVISYLDGIGDRAGKLLPVKGDWHLSFWIKETQPGAKVTVRFQRLNGSSDMFYQETFQPTANWQKIERQFKADDKGPAGTLEFNIKTIGDSGRVLLDDVELGAQIKDNTTSFRPEVLAALKELQPGYLRDWQGQLGDTFDNRIALPFARRSTRYRAGDDSTFSYSFDELFQLAHAVGSQPWIIIPPTLGDDELQKLGNYLTKQIKLFNFNEMLVEFGNENWNSVFRPAGIGDYKTHGETASRAFVQLMIGANNHPALRTIVNGQYVNPWAAQKFLEYTPNAQALAVAPYFLFKLDQLADPLNVLFTQDDFLTEEINAAQKLNKELMIYEVNLHATSGNADAKLRDKATTSAAAGSALAKRLMSALNLGVKKQCIYQLAQYDAFDDQLNGDRGFVKLWGVVRDLSQTHHLRPTGLAMTMLNQTLPGDIYVVKPKLSTTNKDITLTAVHRANGWAIAIVSAKAESQTVTISYPAQKSKAPWRVLSLSSPSPLSTNESTNEVHIEELPLFPQKNTLSLTLNPYGFVVILEN